MPYSFSQESFLSLSLFFSFLAIPQFGLLSHIRSLILSSEHSGLVLTLSMQPTPPCSAPVAGGHERLGYSPLGVVVRCVICGVFVFVFFFLPVMLPFGIPKLTTDLTVRGFPGVWKLLLLHDSLPMMGLHP